jgi:peptidoglycan-associated lipoprotein
MKKANSAFLSSLIIIAVATGCHHKPSGVTPIPDWAKQPPASQNQNANEQPGDKVSVNPNPVTSSEPTPIDYGKFAQLFDGPNNQDREKFKDDTIYFDFDSATIKASEESKLADVAKYFQGNEKFEGLIIEGNCDERGTEKYNLSLGERRALAAREYLHNLGVDDHRLKTVTYGASRPLETGHNEEAWKKNRRDDFVLVTPK